VCGGHDFGGEVELEPLALEGHPQGRGHSSTTATRIGSWRNTGRSNSAKP
jgi:hypothetical protein